MVNVTLENVTTFTNDTSAATNVNNNSALITNALGQALSTQPTTPNSMNTQLDMNSNQIINLPFPGTLDSPVRLADINGLTGGNNTFNITNNNNTFSTTGFYLPNVLPTLTPGGVFDNSPVIDLFNQTTSYTLVKSFPATCTITIANPAVITLNNHRFIQGQPVQFTTTGTLPTGLTAGTTYYVIRSGITTNTFQVSAQNPVLKTLGGAGPQQGDGPPVVTTGTQGGTQSCVALGQEWTEFNWPAGVYHLSTDTSLPGTQTLNKRVRINAYGTVVDDFGIGGQSFTDNFIFNNWVVPVNITQDVLSGVYGGNPIGSTGVFVGAGDIGKFYPGQWVLLCGLDLQGPNSFPPNNHYNEYHQVVSVDNVNNVVNFSTNIRNSYRITWPDYGPISGTGQHYAGPARLVPMSPEFDLEFELNGLHGIDYSGTGSVRYGKFKNCRFEDGANSGQSFFPSSAKKLTFEECEFITTQGSVSIWANVEVDKLIEDLRYINCRGGSLQCQSSSVDQLLIDGCNWEAGLIGTVRNTHVKDCNLGFIQVGAISLGYTSSLTVENTRSNGFSRVGRLDEPFTFPTAGSGNIVNSFGFTNNGTGGTLNAGPLTNGPVNWAVPGNKLYVRDYNNKFDNMGSPFAVLDVRTDGTNTLIDTTLSALPVGNSTNSTVTISIASPAVITWTAHGLPAGTPVIFRTTGSLPTGISPNIIYYIISTGLTTNTFEISATVGGSAINTTGTQSGIQTSISNPLMFFPHPCQRVTVINSWGSAALTMASKAPKDLPMFSYWKTATVTQGLNGGGIQFGTTSPYVWGNINYMNINVIKPYTGSNNPMLLNITANAFNNSLIQGNLNMSVDLTVAGMRTVNPTNCTFAVGSNDVITPFANWITGFMTLAFNTNTTEDQSKLPIVEFEILTDQGITAYSSILGGTISDPFNQTYTIMDDLMPKSPSGG